ncbi:MAG: glycosyltransferase [Bacteroidales bacterium]|nr:glycosyltransferase [Bacteroidales bacterium]
MAEQAPLVSVVVPARNEAGNLGPLIDEIAAAWPATAPSRPSWSMTALPMPRRRCWPS